MADLDLGVGGAVDGVVPIIAEQAHLFMVSEGRDSREEEEVSKIQSAGEEEKRECSGWSSLSVRESHDSRSGLDGVQKPELLPIISSRVVWATDERQCRRVAFERSATKKEKVACGGEGGCRREGVYRWKEASQRSEKREPPSA